MFGEEHQELTAECGALVNEISSLHRGGSDGVARNKGTDLLPRSMPALSIASSPLSLDSEGEKDRNPASHGSNISTSPLLDDLQLVNNNLVGLGYPTMPLLDGLSAEDSAHIVRLIQKLTSQRRRDMTLIEQTSSKLKALSSDRKRLANDKQQLKGQVAANKTEISGLAYQLETLQKKMKREKKMYDEHKRELEKKCVRLETRDTSYQAKIRKQEVAYDRLKARLQADPDGGRTKRGRSSVSRIALSENLEPNAQFEKTQAAHAAAGGLYHQISNAHIEQQKELLSENGRLKVCQRELEAEVEELRRVMKEQGVIIRSQPHLLTSPVTRGSEGGESSSTISSGNKSTPTSAIAWEQLEIDTICAGLEFSQSSIASPIVSKKQ